ncbi:6-phosphogluconolactonase [Candidatus Daviesbacteria bacterium]|nr:6-phosphogluconolactonase [Candidatus Daviesbacteria bacterium]
MIKRACQEPSEPKTMGVCGILPIVTKKNIQIVHCKDKIEASKKSLEHLLQIVDKNTLLFLSGGTSPDLLYQLIAQGDGFKAGAVALIDERYGEVMHDNSNEGMIAQTGLTDYINNVGIPCYKILQGKDLETTANEYEQVIKDLFAKYPKKIAVMGIGADGHTAGIKPGLDYDQSKLVVAFDDKGAFGKRVTLTFKALEKIDEFVILAFGENKKESLQKVFTESDQKKLPASFYNKTTSLVAIYTDC